MPIFQSITGMNALNSEALNVLGGPYTHNKPQEKQCNFNLMVLIGAFFKNRMSESNPCLVTQ